MLPSLGGAAAAPGLDGERHRLHYAARTLLGGLADARPLLLVLDDVALGRPRVRGAARAPRAPPAAVIAAGDRLPGRRARSRGERLTLAPLSREAAEPLLRAPPAPAATPLRAERRQPALPRRARLKGRCPLAFVADELGALSPAALALARGAAVAGEPFAPELAAAAAELDEPAWTRSTSCSARSWCARPTCRGGSGSAIRSCARRSTPGRARAGGSARTLAWRRCWRARARPRAAGAPPRAVCAAG